MTLLVAFKSVVEDNNDTEDESNDSDAYDTEDECNHSDAYDTEDESNEWDPYNEVPVAEIKQCGITEIDKRKYSVGTFASRKETFSSVGKARSVGLKDKKFKW